MEQFFMFDSVDADREVTAADFAKYYSEILTNGVFYRNNIPSLQTAKGVGLVSGVDIGAAFIEGYMYRNTTPISLTHAVGNASFPRIDRVVVRLDRNIAKRDIRIVVKEGVPSTQPVPPELERNDLIYEMSISAVRINAGANTIFSITDERLNNAVCGVVNSLVQLPTDIFLANMDEFEAELNIQLNGVIQSSQDEWDAFMTSIQTTAPALGGMSISVQTEEPINPVTKDIWFDMN